MQSSEQKDGSLTLDDLYDLYQEFSRPLLAFIHSFTNNPDDSQDILQDVFRKAHEAIQNGNIDNSNARAWLYRIAHNEAIDLLRKNKRRTELWQDVTHVSKTAGEFEGQLLDSMHLDELNRFVHTQFTPRERTIFELRYYAQLNLTEISQTVDLSVSQVSRILKNQSEKLTTLWKISEG